MSKKSFKDTPAMVFIAPRMQDIPQYDTQHDAQLPRNGYIRTQGRKGHKKPRINLAFDSDDLLDKVRMQAEKERKSITQLMNEAIIIYLNNTK